MALSAGTVSIAVKPDTANFGSSLKSGVLGGTAGVGEGVGSMILGGLKKFAGPIAAVAAGFSVKKFIDESVHAFEDLAGSVKTMQRISGGSVEQVSGLRGAMQLAGVQAENVTGAITIFSKKLGQAATDSKETAAMNKLFGESIKDANGHVKSMAELLPGLADRFKDMPNGAEKTALATQLFGRAGASMIPVLNKGSEGIAELTEKAKAMGLVIDDAAMKSFGEARESTRNFNAAIQGLKVSVGSDMLPVLEAFQNIMRNAVTPILLATTKFVHEHRDSFVKLAETISEFGKGATGGVMSFLKGLLEQFKPLGPVFAGLIPQLMQLHAAFSPVGLIFQSLQPVLPSLIETIVKLAVSIGTTLGQVLKEILPPITAVVQVLVGTLGDIFKQLMPAIITLADALGKTLGEVVKQLSPIVVLLVQAIAALLPPLMPLISQVIMLAVQAIVPLAMAIMPLITAILPVLVNLFKFIIPIVSNLAQILEAVLVVAIQVVINIFKVIVGVVTTVIGWFTSFVTAIANAAQKVQAWFGGLGQLILTAIGNAGSWLVDVGRNIMDGLWNGLKNAAGAIGNWFSDIAGSWIRQVKSTLGIKSPSTVFYEIGTNIGQGLANGISDSQSIVTDAVSNLGDATISAMSVGASSSASYNPNEVSGGAKTASWADAMTLKRNELLNSLMSKNGYSFRDARQAVNATYGTIQQFNQQIQDRENAERAGTYNIIYNAAPNDSISAEQKLVDAVNRAKQIGAVLI